MRGVLLSHGKGGVGKTSLAHLLALGAAWRGVPAYLMHTDNRPPMKVDGRPYAYYDAREPKTLATLMGAAINNDGFCVIDSGSNRADFDKWMVKSVDLTIIPITPDEEAVSMGLERLKTLESYGATNVRFILNMVSSNKHERLRDFSKYYTRLPRDKILGQLSKVAAVKRLREPDNEPFQTLPTNVNSLSRNLFNIISEAFEEEEQVETKKAQAVG
jgi:chromosome partitioning protein